MPQAAEKPSASHTLNHCRNIVMRVGRVRLLLLLMLLSLGLWLVGAKLVVPPVIESAYRGESWAFLNRMLSGQAVSPVHHYLQKWDRLSLVGLMSILGFWFLALLFSSPAGIRKMVGNATPGSLGAIRMWTCAILLLTTLLEDFGSIAWLPAAVRQPQGLLGYLYPLGLGALVASEMSLRAFQVVTELLLFLGVIGWRTRLVLPCAAVCHLVLLGVLIDYSFFWHQNLVALYVLMVLCFTPCSDGWSVDRLRKIARGHTVPDAERASPVYGWARYACWVVIALPYVQAGLGKLRDGGLFWWHATNMRTNLYMDTLNPREFDWAFSLQLVQAPDVFFALLGVFALCSETFFGLVLFSRLARRIFPVAALLMHIGIFLLQRVLFIDLILLQLLFFDFTGVRKTVGGWLASKRGRLHILYDGLCPLCCRTVHLLTGFDLFTRLEFLDFRRLDLNEYNRRHRLNLALQDLEEEMHVLFRGKLYRGFDGYRRIALALPVLWPLAPWLFLPGLSALGALVYGFVARHRLTLLWCDAHCPVQPAEAGEAAQGTTTGDGIRGFGAAVAVSGIILVASLLWVYQIEFYPFTSFSHLYSTASTSGKVEYKKVLARHKSGVSARARLEETIGALAWDARYSRFLARCFQERPADVAICKTFLRAAAAAYNKQVPPGERVTHYEIQVWHWDFRASPFDPNYGQWIDRFVYDITTGRALRETTFEDGSRAAVAPSRVPADVPDGAGAAR
jgi:predicted DCC family thiol-disulfide oxidoreductase YuxK